MTYNYREIVPYLLDWFDLNARILAWRENPKPYYVWISEIMLQQTRVEAVKGYFDRFITVLPDIRSLAEAEEELLLKLWQGLGYYNRVRNLQKAARIVVKRYGGELPADYDELIKLPGIGDYTAGAIASIAYQLPVPAVDGNVLRVTKRIAGSFDDITDTKVKRNQRNDLLEIMPERSGDFNQSLMELGALICLPNGKPLCKQCPVMHICKAFHNNTIAQIPVKPARKERKIEERTILFLDYQGTYAIRKRAPKGLLAGLWEYPGLEGKLSRQELSEILMRDTLLPLEILSMGEAKHVFSHVEWHMIGYYIKLSTIPAQLNGCVLDCIWAGEDQIKKVYSIPSAFHAFSDKYMGNKGD